MANILRVALEIAPRGKRVAAVALDWPGLERGAKTDKDAVERLLSCVPRYVPVAKLAGMGAGFAPEAVAEVVERYQGTGSTDFWGISFAFSSFDEWSISPGALERELALMRACWAYFDEARARVSAELRKGPRGGGRDREQIARHTIATEQDWAKKLGVDSPADALLTDVGLNAHREAYCGAIRAYHAQGKQARGWPLRFLIRHTAFHTLDHAWEMVDKDLASAG